MRMMGNMYGNYIFARGGRTLIKKTEKFRI